LVLEAEYGRQYHEERGTVNWGGGLLVKTAKTLLNAVLLKSMY